MSVTSARRFARALVESASSSSSSSSSSRVSAWASSRVCARAWASSTSTRPAREVGAPPNSDASSSAVRAARDALTLTDACARRLRALAEEDASTAGEGGGTRLRLAVEGGGCSGFKYEFTLEREGGAEGGDRVFRAENGAEVVVDDVSYEFVRGATIDYVEEMIKSSFEVVQNPQADASCGCGASFGAKESAFGALDGQT